jgi:hypothetical protein
MLDVEVVILDELELLSPLQSDAAADWREVLRRANTLSNSNVGRLRPSFPERKRPKILSAKRRVVVGFALLVVVLVPVLALGAANDWWFFKSGYAPTPTSTPVVVKHGVWDGHPWELDAYRSTTNGLCFAVKATNSDKGAAMGCLNFVGIARTNQTRPTPDSTITYMSRGGNHAFPAYIAGPVIANAVQVEIRFPDGQTLRVPTFAAPRSLGRVRFYATPLPAHEFLPEWGAGLNAWGQIIACLLGGHGGPSPLSACK